MGDCGDNKFLNVSSEKDAPRLVSPSDAMETMRNLVLSRERFTPSRTVWIISACSSPVSFLQSPEASTARPG